MKRTRPLKVILKRRINLRRRRSVSTRSTISSRSIVRRGFSKFKFLVFDSKRRVNDEDDEDTEEQNNRIKKKKVCTLLVDLLAVDRSNITVFHRRQGKDRTMKMMRQPIIAILKVVILKSRRRRYVLCLLISFLC
jgi:hypothetical protein